MWLFTLNAHDALAGAHKFSVGIPLVAAAAYLVLFTARQIYLDFAELQRNMTDADQDCRDAEPTSADLTPGPDGDGVDEVETPPKLGRCSSCHCTSSVDRDLKLFGSLLELS